MRKRELSPRVNKAPVDIQADGKGHFVVAGKTEDGLDTHYLLKLDDALHVLWETADQTQGFLYGVAIMSDELIAVSGHKEPRNEYYAALYTQSSGKKILDIFLIYSCFNLI